MADVADSDARIEAEAAPPEDAEILRYPRMGGDGPSRAIYIGHAKDGWRDAYHFLLTIPLWRFLAVMAGAYVAINAIFGALYLAVGGVAGMRPGSFSDAFFFSVETISTIGYGEMSPQSAPAHLVMTLESFVGLFNLAIATGLLFARFSRPTARVMFSDRAVVTLLDGSPTLMFRAANQRRNRIVDAEVTLSLVRDRVSPEGHSFRGFQTLQTVRARSPVFVLTWTIMHVIDETSPLYGETMQSLLQSRAEIVAILKGLDETFAQTIHARASYQPQEIVWGRKFADIFGRNAEGRPVIDYTHFHDIV